MSAHCTGRRCTWDEPVVTARAPRAPGAPGSARTGLALCGDTASRATGPASTGCPHSAGTPAHSSRSPVPTASSRRGPPSAQTTLPPPGPGPRPPQLLNAEPRQSPALQPHSGALPTVPPSATLPCAPAPVPPRDLARAARCPLPLRFRPLTSPSRDRLRSDCQPCTPSPGPRLLDIQNHPALPPGVGWGLCGLSGESLHPVRQRLHCRGVRRGRQRGPPTRPWCPGSLRTASPYSLQHRGQLRPGACTLLHQPPALASASHTDSPTPHLGSGSPICPRSGPEHQPAALTPQPSPLSPVPATPASQAFRNPPEGLGDTLTAKWQREGK